MHSENEVGFIGDQRVGDMDHRVAVRDLDDPITVHLANSAPRMSDKCSAPFHEFVSGDVRRRQITVDSRCMGKPRDSAVALAFDERRHWPLRFT